MSRVNSCKISHPSVGRDSDEWGALCTPIVILRQKTGTGKRLSAKSTECIDFFIPRVAGSIVNLDSAVKSRLKEKSIKKTMLKSLALAVVGSMCAVGAANASPMLDGGLSMSGSYTPVNADGDLTSILLATGIDFGAMYTGGIDNTFGVVTATGSFDVLNLPNPGDPQTTGTITDFQFKPFVATPGTPLWTVGGFSFVMSSLTSDTIPKGGSYDLTIYGLGTMKAIGYTDTPGFWSFTGQGANNANFSWSARLPLPHHYLNRQRCCCLAPA